MQIVCISASNVECARRRSASTRACQIIAELAAEQVPGAHSVEILPLVDYALNPCGMCGNCFTTGQCERDPDFNRIYAAMGRADAIFLVCPHYSPFPSKLMMLLEKINEIAYLNFCANPEYRSPLSGRPVGLAAHGGQGEEAVPYYQETLLRPLANAFGGVGARVTRVEGIPGVAFGIRSLETQTDSVFVKIEHDWEDIRARLRPLVAETLKVAEAPRL